MARTYNDLFLDIRNNLSKHDIDTSNFDARYIVCFASGKTNAEFVRDMSLYSSPEIEERALSMMERRISGEPLAYVTGAWEFHGLPFFITKDVLIPRIDTEVLVDAAIELLQNTPSPRVLDLCCGSGCIGISIAKKIPQSKIISVDISGAALQICRKNVNLNKLNSRVICMQADAKQAPPRGMGSYDMIVCNPPYIPSEEIGTLDHSVKDFEPVWALDGGQSGLDFYEAIIAQWSSLLKPGGHILFEVGEKQSRDVLQLLKDASFQNFSIKKDTINVERVVIAEKQ